MSNSNSSSTNSHEQRGASCPCKRLPLCLSSFTAAEHGNFQALMRHVDNNNINNNTTLIADRQDDYGNTPLHLAAQHGHVAATAMLLQANCRVNAQDSGATPLHRASFSGAVATMQLLINHKKEECSLLVQDSSFGDFMTPLHKAASGGRYLAVQLLLDAHTSRQSLSQALAAVDAAGATPLQVALEKNANAAIERQSVARWDAVAGHAADWEKCIQLLQQAQYDCHDESETNNSNNNAEILGNHNERNIIQTKQQFPEVPLSLSSSSSSRAACLVCPTTDDGKCLTSSWESQFWSALAQSTEQQLCKTTNNKPIIMDDDDSSLWNNNENNEKKNLVVENMQISTTAEDQEEQTMVIDKKNSATQNKDDDHEIMSNEVAAASSSSNSTLPSSSSSSSPSSSRLGRLCSSCHTQTFALYPCSTTGGLVCKKCQRKGRRRRL